MPRKFNFKNAKSKPAKQPEKIEKLKKGKNTENQPNNPLHGIKLTTILEELVEHYGWEEMGTLININSFISNPSIKSSLKFLRRTPWAREKVEQLYLRMIRQ